MNRPFPSRVALVATLMLLCVLPAAAQQRMSLENLVETSEAVVLARTMSTESFWNEDRTAILTRVILEVEDQLTGLAPGRTEVIVPGGRIGNIIQEVSDMPTFTADEESVVFLERHRTGVLIVSGGLHGKLPVERDRDTGIRFVTGASTLFETSTVETTPDTPEAESDTKEDRIPLGDFKTRFKDRIR